MLSCFSCVRLCNTMNCSPPGSSVHVILQAKLLEQVAISFFRESFQPRDQNRVSCIVGKESACNAGDPVLIPGSGRASGEGTGYPLQYSWTSLVVQLVKNPPAMQETWFNPWVGKIHCRWDRLCTPVFWPTP